MNVVPLEANAVQMCAIVDLVPNRILCLDLIRNIPHSVVRVSKAGEVIICLGFYYFFFLAFGGSVVSSATNCGNIKCSVFEKCIMDPYTKRMKCVRT